MQNTILIQSMCLIFSVFNAVMITITDGDFVGARPYAAASLVIITIIANNIPQHKEAT